VENEAQSAQNFSRGKAYPADRLGLPARWVSLGPRSDGVLVGGKQGLRMGCFGIRGCVRLGAFVLVFLRQEGSRKPAIKEELSPFLLLRTGVCTWEV
jgi:hypothetical protein